MFDFVNNIGDAEIDNYLTDSSAMIDRLGLGFFYEIRHGSFDERIVTEHKTKTSVYADVNKYFWMKNTSANLTAFMRVKL